MKKVILLILIISACANSTIAQINLVSNPSFEDSYGCGSRLNNIKFAKYWSSIQDTIFSTTDTLGPPNCTPEYCSTCVPYYSSTSVPLSAYYFHYPRTGNAFAHMITYYKDDFDTTTTSRRDYLQGRLKNTLTSGKQYEVGFYISLTQTAAYASNNVGAYLDDGTIDTTTLCGMPQITHHPQVYDTSIYTDTLHWKKIGGSFTANGTEKFITIGNFFDGAHTDTIFTHYWNWGVLWSGTYLVDDVSVIPCDNIPFAGNDTMIHRGDSVWIGPHEQTLPYTWYKLGSTVAIDSGGGMWVKPLVTTTYVLEQKLCGVTKYDTVLVNVWPVGVTEVNQQLGNVVIYPNPAANELTIQNAKDCGIVFYDIVGKAMLHAFCNSDKEVIDISALPEGVYTMQVVDMDTGEKIVRKVIKK